MQDTMADSAIDSAPDSQRSSTKSHNVNGGGAGAAAASAAAASTAAMLEQDHADKNSLEVPSARGNGAVDDHQQAVSDRAQRLKAYLQKAEESDTGLYILSVLLLFNYFQPVWKTFL